MLSHTITYLTTRQPTLKDFPLYAIRDFSQLTGFLVRDKIPLFVEEDVSGKERYKRAVTDTRSVLCANLSKALFCKTATNW